MFPSNPKSSNSMLVVLAGFRNSVRESLVQNQKTMQKIVRLWVCQINDTFWYINISFKIALLFVSGFSKPALDIIQTFFLELFTLSNRFEQFV